MTEATEHATLGTLTTVCLGEGQREAREVDYSQQLSISSSTERKLSPVVSSVVNPSAQDVLPSSSVRISAPSGMDV